MSSPAASSSIISPVRIILPRSTAGLHLRRPRKPSLPFFSSLRAASRWRCGPWPSTLACARSLSPSPYFLDLSRSFWSPSFTWSSWILGSPLCLVLPRLVNIVLSNHELSPSVLLCRPSTARTDGSGTPAAGSCCRHSSDRRILYELCILANLPKGLDSAEMILLTNQDKQMGPVGSKQSSVLSINFLSLQGASFSQVCRLYNFYSHMISLAS